MGSDGEKEIDTVKGFFVLKLDELPTYIHNAYDDRHAMTKYFHEKFGAQQPGLSAGSHLTPKPQTSLDFASSTPPGTRSCRS